MIATDKDALICDLAETYGIFDYRGLPVQTLAVLSAGLRDDSRIKLKIAGSQFSLETILMASIADSMNILVWQRSKEGIKGKNPPKSILAALTGMEHIDNSDVEIYESPEAFEKRWSELTKGAE